MRWERGGERLKGGFDEPKTPLFNYFINLKGKDFSFVSKRKRGEKI